MGYYQGKLKNIDQALATAQIEFKPGQIINDRALLKELGIGIAAGGIIVKSIQKIKQGIPDGHTITDIGQFWNPPILQTKSGQDEVTLAFIPLGSPADSTAQEVTLLP